ncbi:phosphoglucomutase [Mycena pura]|uniref:phosphoglucomutase (alpha-D-glucose-1,6-bisphosphate-dependent) n=1 Tax=Mycena pura TaxID=153505 RepID=A0AAD7E2Q7_9AGAR|nr:phosphoglucomutase [Mycena pura]
MSHTIKEIPTKPFDGQKPGTSGLRKRVKVFQQEHYTENFIQSIFDSIDAGGATLVIGGDGRYFSPETVQTILKIGSANGVAKFIVGKDAILSTPAASNVIRKYKAYGGILLTASHNPGGPDKDFGIKYNVSNGGPAPENVTDKIFENTKTIKSYKIIDAPPVDLSKTGEFSYGPTDVSIIDSVADYVELLKSIFDFSLIKSFLSSRSNEFRVLFDGLHGVTGPYATALFVDVLGLPKSSVQNCVPLPDFGGGHPDPNLTYAHTLVEAVETNGIQFGAASDGDGDRNMIYGKGAFVTPSDSVAIIAHWADVIPYFKKGGVKGLARSMPTSKAIDLVAKKKGFEYFEVPTGWKFFGNLMDAGRLSICGEESFGTGSDHIREKDGLWAVIAWLNILAAANAQSPNKLVGINDILSAHYKTYGRSFFSRYDYEEVPSSGAAALVAHIDKALTSRSLNDTTHKSASTGTSFTVSDVYNFAYTDPIDKSVSKNQGHVIVFSDGSRVVFRLSGTGSEGATVRMYVERYVAPEADEAELTRDAAEGLKGLIEVALELSKLKEFLGRDEPTVITVSRICFVLVETNIVAVRSGIHCTTD